MRYKWIELQGYAGIYNGMGLTQIKIDFTKCKTNKIIIRGNNGSGKSTIINAINPNPDSNDKFIPGVEARKNICLIDNGIEYVIRYIHPVTNSGRGTTKGYISKTINGQLVELNPNGNISSCKDILYEEFNLDSNFISLSRLSSEDRGIVDSKPAERKKLLNAIINTLDVYNGIYKNLSKKASVFKQMINSLTYKIDYLGNEIQLNARLQNVNSRLSALEKEKDTTIEASAAVRVKISEYVGILRDNNYDSVVSELREVTAHIKSVRGSIIKKMENVGIADINYIEAFYNHLDKNIAIIEAEIASIASQIQLLLGQREIESRDLKNKQAKLDSLQSEHSYADIKEAVENARRIIKEYGQMFANFGLTHADLITKTEFDMAMEALKYVKGRAYILTSSYSLDELKFVVEHYSEAEENVRSMKGKNQRLTQLRIEKTEVDSKIAVYTAKQDLIGELSKRPKNCTIDSCPYIENAIAAATKYPKSELDNLINKSKYLDDMISEFETSVARAMVQREIIGEIESIMQELDGKWNVISKLPIDPNFQLTFMNRVVALDKFADIDLLYSYIDYGNLLEEYRIAQEQLRRYESEYKIYEAKNDILESMIRDINSLMQKTEELANQIDQLNSDQSSRKTELASLKSAKTVVEDLLLRLKEDLRPSEQRESELIKIKQTLDVNSTEINRLQSELDGLNANLGAVNNDIKALTEERDSIKHSLILLADYNTELQEYTAKFTKIDRIRYYSSPSTGIQTLFMQLYMNKIITIANDLLSFLFEGEFVLQPFIINETEFRIPCLGSGLLHDDISSMSTAQKCMISMILSFSILYQSSSKYNVLMLDEIDSGLDTSNRGLFVELLTKIMSMLNVEQCFLISHNNELNTAACDIIVLKNNNNEVYQGNIIWQY